MQNKKKLIVIVGPTAIGKTSLSVSLAKHFNCEILSADSRQFYKEMEVGTAKPTPSEMDGVPHHFVNNLSIHENYTAGQFEIDAIKKLNQLYQKDDYAILVGGSGLFVNAVCFGLDDIPGNSEIRNQLIKEFETHGIENLQEQVKVIDPVYYATADVKNPHRLMRALEVFKTSGKTYSSFRNKQTKQRTFNIVWVGLNRPREEVYNNINKRVDIMLEKGLLHEVTKLESFKNLSPLKTVGYQEFYPLTQSKPELKEAIEKVKQNTRRFAKRQITFFRKNESVKWFKPSEISSIINFINCSNKD